MQMRMIALTHVHAIHDGATFVNKSELAGNMHLDYDMSIGAGVCVCECVCIQWRFDVANSTHVVDYTHLWLPARGGRLVRCTQ